MELNDLLTAKQLDLRRVLILRHSPVERNLRSVLPWLAAEQPVVFNAYQQAHWSRVEKAMTNADYVVSCIGQKAGEATFVGIYKVDGWKAVSLQGFWDIPANIELRNYGMTGLTTERPETLWFDLELQESYSDWKGKLILNWPGLERSWHRWAANNHMAIKAILLESVLVAPMPAWNELILTREEIRALVPSWRTALSHWRGIYFIFDVSDGKGYVGSAYGADNLLNRWQSYALTGHGGNVQLRGRNPENFRFSILQRVSPDLDQDEVVQMETNWKKRLHTREYGLNGN